MWCPTCRQDVATESSADGAAVICRECRRPLEVLLPGEFDTRQARELLERWSHEDLLEPPPVEESSDEPTAADEPAVADDAVENAAANKRRANLRLDGAHAPVSGPSHDHKGPPPPRGRRAKSAPAPRPARRHDVAHMQVPAPHFSMEAFVSSGGKSPGASESLWGQLLAYLGVGLLTIGTTLVLWGYFGGPANYAPTGWLVATAGQMLLFLGVVTLVSGGMQQTTHEVAQRVTFLGEHMLRIEEATQQVLQGPHFGRTPSEESAKSLSGLEDTGEFETPPA